MTGAFGRICKSEANARTELACRCDRSTDRPPVVLRNSTVKRGKATFRYAGIVTNRNYCALRRVCICAVVASPLLASYAHANEPTFFDRVIAWFNPDKIPPDTSASDATPYTVTFEIAGAERSVRSAVTDASSLESLKRQAPAGAAGLLRRAFVDRDRILAALYTEGRYGGTVTIIVAGRSPDDPAAYEAVNAARRSGPVPVKVLVEPGPVFKFGAVHVLDATGRRFRPRPRSATAAVSVRLQPPKNDVDGHGHDCGPGGALLARPHDRP